MKRFTNASSRLYVQLYRYRMQMQKRLDHRDYVKGIDYAAFQTS